MRRIVGPIVTTGVALVASGVVVANPLIASHADIRIPAVQLSGTSDATGMLDQSFLDAIAPAAPESTNPFSVLKQLVSSLAGDATAAGRNAVVRAFVAGITASAPELTATSIPYVAVPAADLSALAGFVVPGGLDPAVVFGPVTAPSANLPDPVPFIAESVAPAVDQFVTSLSVGAGAIGGDLVAAAFAVGTVVANEPKMIVDTLVALVQGDFSGALEKAVAAITAPLGPPTMIIEAITNFFEQLPDPAPAAPTLTTATDVAAEAPARAAEARAERPAPETTRQRKARENAEILLSAPAPAAVVPSPAAAIDTAVAAVLPDLNLELPELPELPAVAKATPARKAPRETVKSVADQVGAVAGGVADRVGAVTGRAADAVGKAAARAHGARTGSAAATR